MNFTQIWANLPVDDLKRTEKFYTALGFRLNGSPNADLVSFLFSEKNFVIHFFVREKLELSMNDKTSDSAAGSEIIFSISAKSKDEVDNWANNAEQAGGKVFRKAARHEDGYFYCVFADPDGHKFNALFLEQGM